jgi:sporulation protein YlmC with PRC-barrel domain
MLRSLKDMTGYKILAKDVEIGKVNDFYFDDDNWVVRYLVDKTGLWFLGKQVIISPASFEKPDWENKEFPVSLTKEQVKNSPPIECEEPVSKEIEKKIAEYYGWPMYGGGHGIEGWAGGTTYANSAVPYLISRNIVKDKIIKEEGLRSTNEVTGYEITADGEKIGYVKDFIIDDETWAIRYMVLETSKVLKGKNVIIAPEWINWISWYQKQLSVDIPKEKIKKCPDFEISAPISREYEELLYKHYRCTKYWEQNH